MMAERADGVNDERSELTFFGEDKRIPILILSLPSLESLKPPQVPKNAQ